MPAYTWTTGETITAPKLQALEDEAWRVVNKIVSGSSTSQSTTSSTSFVDAAASVTFTAAGTQAYIEVHGGGAGVDIASIATTLFIAIGINGTDYVVSHTYTADTDLHFYPFSGGVLVTGLTAGTSYTAKLRIRVDQATSTGYINHAGSSRQTITVHDIVK